MLILGPQRPTDLSNVGRTPQQFLGIVPRGTQRHQHMLGIGGWLLIAHPDSLMLGDPNCHIGPEATANRGAKTCNAPLEANRSRRCRTSTKIRADEGT